MRSFIILISASFLLSCSNDDNIDSSNIIGTWKLEQVLADPGDGSGVFVDVDSDKTITFLDDDTFSSNGNICFFNPLEERNTIGEFSSEDGELIPINCNSFAFIKQRFKLEDNSLIMSYSCIEACAEKYVKIE